MSARPVDPVSVIVGVGVAGAVVAWSPAHAVVLLVVRWGSGVSIGIVTGVFVTVVGMVVLWQVGVGTIVLHLGRAKGETVGVALNAAYLALLCVILGRLGEWCRSAARVDGVCFRLGVWMGLWLGTLGGALWALELAG